MNIGELGRLTGVSTKAIRYYEEIGVLKKPERSPNGYNAQLTGLTLGEITTILDQRGRGESTCEHVIGLLDHHLLELDTRIETLEKTRSKLRAIAKRSRELDPSDCVDPNRCQTIAPLTEFEQTDQAANHPREHAHTH